LQCNTRNSRRKSLQCSGLRKLELVFTYYSDFR
jgi:hypothetical protein